MRRVRTRGQTMVEFALVAPVFFLLTLGVVDFSRAAWAYNTVAFLARDGARYGTSPSHGVNAIASHVKNRCTTMLSDMCYTPPLPASFPPNSVAINVARGCGSTSSAVTVTVTDYFEPASPLIANLWGGGTLDLQATSQMYVEPAPAGGCAA